MEMNLKSEVKKWIDGKYWETIRSIRKEYPIGGITKDGLVNIIVYREGFSWSVMLGKIGGVYKVAIIEEIWD
jgi:hypothetical protein